MIHQGIGRINNNSWIAVQIYNMNVKGELFNKKLSNWVGGHLSMGSHQCINETTFEIYNPRAFVDRNPLFGVDVGIRKDGIPDLFNKKCIFCVYLKEANLNENKFTDDEEEIVRFYDLLKEKKNGSTVPTTKTLFAWWPDLFVPLDRTHNYNNIVFEFQTYGVDLPINRGNEIQKIDGARYVKILRVIQFQLHQWIGEYNKDQMDLRRIDGSMKNTPFQRVIDKNYW